MTIVKPPPLRLAVVGLGHFAQVAVLPAIRQLKTVELTALVSGSPDKLRTVGDRHRVKRRCGYEEYDELLASGDVDAVYIALPNDQHAEFTIRAARLGVHVLCEKPMATTEEECVAMIDACEEHHAKLMIAYRLHFESGNLRAIELVQDRYLGEPKVFTSVFSMQVRDGNIRVQARAGAGPLHDIGIYCVNAARYLFRSEPVAVTAMQVENRDESRFSHVPESISALLRFPGGQIAQFTASFGAADRSHYEIVGTQGRLELEQAYEYTQPMKMLLVRGEQRQTRTFRKKDQIAAEIEYFARCIRDDMTPEPSGYEGLADVRIMAAIQRAAETGGHVALDLPARRQRPDLDQSITIPAHGKPRLVDVEGAST